MRESTMTEAICCCCEKTQEVKPDKRGSVRLPRGWRNVSGRTWCGACWNSRYTVRAVTLPVWGVDGGDISSLWETARSLWRATADLCNWASSTLFAADIVRSAEMEKLPAMPPIYLYGLAGECEPWRRIPDKQSGATILRHVEQCYRADRFDVVWRGAKSLRSYREDQPYPISSQAVRLEIGDDGGVIVDCRLGGARHRLKPARGRRYDRQMAGLRNLVENPDLLCECAIYPAARRGDSRQGSDSRDNSGGGRKRQDMLLKVVGWFPIDDSKASGTLRLRTASDALLVAVTPEGDRVWTYNADHARKLVSLHQAHLSRLQRLGDDRKAERRKPRRDNRELVAMYDHRATKDRDRLRSLVHEVTAAAVNFARRCKASSIEYDDTDKSFAASFPWRTMLTVLDSKCRANGVRLISRASVPDETPGPLATE